MKNERAWKKSLRDFLWSKAQTLIQAAPVRPAIQGLRGVVRPQNAIASFFGVWPRGLRPLAATTPSRRSVRRFGRKALVVGLSASLMLGTWPVSLAVAAVPSTMSYQGNLWQNGIPVNASKTMVFRITNASGATEYWTSGAMAVTVTKGNFKADLSPTGVSWQTITPYIEVTVEGSVLLPREPLNAVPYALTAGVVDGAVQLSSTQTFSGQNTFLNMVSVSSDVLMTGTLNRTANLLVGGPGYSVTFASAVTAGWFYGNGAGLTNVSATPPANMATTDTNQAISGVKTFVSTLTVQGNAFSVGGSTMAVTSGNLGIGTVSPATRLAVEGGDLTVRSGANVSTITATGFFGSGAGLTGVVASSLGDPIAVGTLQGKTGNAGITISTSTFITSGNLGIGTTAPASKIHVLDGDIRVSTSAGQPSKGIVFQDGTIQATAAGGTGGGWTDAGSVVQLATPTDTIGSTGAGVTVSTHLIVSAGNVGIGTASPVGKFDIVGSGAGTQLLSIRDLLGGSFGIDLQGVGLTSRAAFKRSGGGAPSVEVMSIPLDGANAGNVGIGTTNPATSLDVFGPLRFGAFSKANLPAAGTAGRIARVTDDVGGLWMDNGSSWNSLRGYAVTSEFSSLQAAIDSLPAGGGTVVIPSDTILDVSATVNFPTNKRVELRGMGWSSKIRWTGGNSSAIISLPGIPMGQSGYRITDLQFIKSGAQSGVAAISVGQVGGVISMLVFDRILFFAMDIGIKLIGEADQAVIRNNWFFDVGAAGIQGRQNTGSVSDLKITDNHFQGLTNWGIDIDGGSQYNIIGNTFQGTNSGARGIVLDRFDAAVIQGNYFELQGAPVGPAIHLGPTGFGPLSNMAGALVSGNHIQLVGAATKIIVGFSDATTIMNNWIEGSAPSGGIGIQVTANASNTVIGPNSWGPSLATRISEPGPTDSARLDAAVGFRLPATNFTGNVGIGTASPVGKFDIVGSGAGTQLLSIRDILGGSFGIDLQGVGLTSRAAFKRSGGGAPSVEVMSIPLDGANAGNVGIGTTAPGALLHVNSSGAGVVARFQNTAGTCDHTPGAASETVTCSSDVRLKTDITDAPTVLEELAKLRIRRYKIKSTGEEAIGVIAQEVQKVAPELVKEDNSGTLMVSQIAHWKLIKAIQELEAHDEGQRAVIEQLKANDVQLRAELEALRKRP